MKTRKIVDYVVINEYTEDSKNLLLRIDLKRDELNKKINNFKAYLENSLNEKKRLKFVQEVYNKYQNDLCPPLTIEEENEWDKNANKGSSFPFGEYDHPSKYEHFKADKVYTDFAKSNIKKSQTKYISTQKKINEAIIEIEDRCSEYSFQIEQLQRDLELIEKNPDPTLNKSVRTSFEQQILDLIQKGYEPVGGISVSKGISYQAMARYENS
ncbi:hypothetical protein [Dokdonia donghaensis]|uniref:Uncharacterized protein n=1 Tax=Dokdonia donghaensis DSW-1 TaxID=1300343 RepID=A0A0A2GUC7_9FLAO|nr:hypothetical protein [Dokdonia donghaensis]ANH60861.1 hypothetical protein I597_1963 [Dokdonia donghaensis DSW-1]KGO05886.1 hypothetical protein NV36_02840 [Dokdonia donghaensis DSW-1]